MTDANVSKRLQKTIVLYSAVGLFVVGAIVALVGVLPLAMKLREAHQRNLLVDLQRQSLAAEQFLGRVSRSTSGTANRTQVRERMEAHLRGELPRDKFETGLSGLMRDSLGASTNIVAFHIFGTGSNLLARFGRPIPTELPWPWPEAFSREAALAGPIRSGDQTFMLAAANMFNAAETQLGTLVVLYNTHDLQRIVEEETGLGRSGEVVLGARQHKALPIFFPMRQARAGRTPDPGRIAVVMEGLQLANTRQTGIFEPQPPLDASLVLAYGPIKGREWGMVVCMERAELLSGINRLLTILGLVLGALVLLGTFGMVVMLRPLTGRVILHTDELESQIYEKTAALNTELGERKRAEQSLRDSEALYHSLVDTLPINILRKDLCGRVSYGNRGYCERMGKPLVELLGKTDYQLFPRELADKYCRDDEKVVRTGEMFEDIEEHRAGDGKKLYVHVLKAPVRDAQGKVVGTQIIFWDVTARRLAEEALERAAAELARSNKELEQFAYVASHDLQEPLRMITSYTQLIAQRYKDKLDPDAKDFMHFAVDGALRMQRLIQGLLQYSRVGTRGKPFEPVECREALDAALANLKMAVEESNAAIHQGTLPRVMGDPLQLIQLFQNLVGNALKFRSPRAPEIHITTERRPRQDAAVLSVPPYEWVITVGDNGIGIEPQYYDRIFVIFQRLHTHEQYPGTGIGLAICRKIVERHGGQIWVESKTGESTHFHFTLPALD
ncbi:MAG TPA: ATP-binding protein [Candidatus Saccharimonadales bacterium]|nr:ATP-binding protein [Candidatus Saccharimonadales bacterium]